jgi:glycosyltransferase involved in cell wall biosynthesis
MKIIYLPLEELDQRYTKMMNNAIGGYLTEKDIVVYPKFKKEKIKRGEFLDIVGTNIFKSRQLEMVCKLFDQDKIKNGDRFLVADIFYPGLEMIPYMANLLGIKIHIFGYNHAGRSDPNDFVQKLGKWSDNAESTWHQICDGIFIGSHDHKRLMHDYFPEIAEEKIIVTGCVWDIDYVLSLVGWKQDDLFDNLNKVKKEEFVIWPHRPAPEKGFNNLLTYAKQNPNRKIIMTTGGNKRKLNLPKNIKYLTGVSKKELYKLMIRAKYYLSTSYQETFGYTLQEAMLFGCIIAVPNRACYPEMVPSSHLYDSISQIESRFNETRPIVHGAFRHHDNAKTIVDRVRNFKGE